MESIILFIIAIFTVSGSMYVGFRIGRIGSANRPSRADNAEAVDRDRRREEAAATAQQAIASIEQSNRETAEVLQKMRNLIANRRVSDGGDNTVSKDN